LIKEGLIQIPETAKPSTSSDSQEIPTWVKNNVIGGSDEAVRFKES